MPQVGFAVPPDNQPPPRNPQKGESIMATQAELDLDGVRAKVDAVKAAVEKDRVSTTSASQDAVDNAVEDLENQLEEVKVQYLDNSKPRYSDDSNTAPGKAPKDVAEPKSTSK